MSQAIEKLEKAIKEIKKGLELEDKGIFKKMPSKYRKQAERDIIRITKDLDVIYNAHARLYERENKILDKYDFDWMDL